MKVNIDKSSGFCFGVVSAIRAAENELEEHGEIYCLGDIVHNTEELNRLATKGLKYISHDDFKQLKNTHVLIRAHGEPPETYKIALKNNITLIDASCPVVLKLQANIRKAWLKMKSENGQLVICGKHNHAEVIGLLGQTDNEAIVISNINEIDKIDFTRAVELFAQTTQSVEVFNNIANEIKKRMQANNNSEVYINAHNTTCGAVSNRVDQLTNFSTENDVVIFVSDKKSSNGKFLYDICLNANPNSYFISKVSDIDTNWFINKSSVGICGATSTPLWLMKEIENFIANLN